MKIISSCKTWFCLFLLAALAGCRTPPPPPRLDPEIEREVATGRRAYAAGAVERAAESFARALQRARLIDDNAEIARDAYNLAACLAAQQKWADAAARLDEAQAACAAPANPPAEFSMLRVKIMRGAGRTNDAIAMARAWLADQPPRRAAATRPAMQILLAEMLCDAGDCPGAAAELAQIPEKTARSLDNITRADWHRTRARIAAGAGSERDAGQAYDQAAEAYRRAGRYAAMAGCLAEAGRAYAAGGDKPAAVDRFHRAARSLREQGRPEDARTLINQALPLAANDSAARQILENLAAALAQNPPPAVADK